MKCLLCGFEFNENDVQRACKGCVLMKKCDLVKCPNCDYEMAPDPQWIKRLKEKRKRGVDKHGTE